MQHILITGRAGFIGSNFVRYMLGIEPDIQVFNLDALTYAGSLENLKALPDPQRHTFVMGNVCDRALVEEVIRQNKIDTVVHFAAETHVDRSIVDPETCLKTNVFGTNTLLEAVRQVWIAEKLLPLNKVHFHHISTDEVFGSLAPGEAAFSETTPYAPNSPYAAPKAGAKPDRHGIPDLSALTQQVEQGHPHSHAIGHLIQDDGMGTVRHFGTDFDSPLYGAGMHDENVVPGFFQSGSLIP